MTLPTISAQSTRTTNFATSFTATIPIASIPKGSLVSCKVVGATAGGTPDLRVANHTGGLSITTEDETTTGTSVINTVDDSALSNDSSQGAWILSVRIDDYHASTTDLDFTVNANGIGANDRAVINVIPPTYGIIPARSSRIAAKFFHNNTGTGASTYNLARRSGGVVPTDVPCYATCAFRSASGTATDCDVDFDHSGVFETSSTATGFGDGANGSGRVVLATNMQDCFANALWDIGASTISGSGGIDFRTTTTPGAQKAYVGVLYKIGTPPPPGGTVTESETVWPMGPFPGKTVTEQEIVFPAITPGGTVVEAEQVTAHSALPAAGATVTEAEQVTAGQVFAAGFGVIESEIVYQAVGYDIIEGVAGLDPPRSSPFRLLSLVANVYCRPGDVGSGRIALLDGATVIDETVWTALTSTPTLLTLPITGTVSGPNNLRMRWGERASTLDSLVPFFEDVDLNVEYWVAESETVFPHSALPAGHPVTEQESVIPHATLPPSGGTVNEAEVLRQHQPLPGQRVLEAEVVNPSAGGSPAHGSSVVEAEVTNTGQLRAAGSSVVEAEHVFSSILQGKSVVEAETVNAGQVRVPGGTVVEAEQVHTFVVFGGTVVEVEQVNTAVYLDIGPAVRCHVAVHKKPSAHVARRGKMRAEVRRK